MAKAAVAEIWFPFATMLFSIVGVLLGISRYQKFMERTRSRRAEHMSFVMAQRAAESLKGFVEVVITAVVPHESTVLIGYSRTSPPRAEDPLIWEEGRSAAMTGTMVAWLDVTSHGQLDQLNAWCNRKSPVLLRLDTEAKLLGFYSLEQDDTVELALQPRSK
ncbi:MAG: hypothetical protein HKL82_02150 [Acidimicrobiaceae bacterium]|nr:hypothetical protein [Acidimicrobiaceae bacterium]